MMTTDEIADLRARAHAVRVSPTSARVSPRAAAACLSGVVRLIASSAGVDVMRHACAALVRHTPAWETSLRLLPDKGTGTNVSSAIEMIAVVARGILPLCGVDGMKAALSFWACETDPAEWRAVSEAA